MANDDPGKNDVLARGFLIIVAIALIIGAVLGVRVLLSQRAGSSAPATQPPQASTSGVLAELNRQVLAGMRRLAKALEEMQSHPPEPTAQSPEQRRAKAGAAAPVKPPVTQKSDPQRSYGAAAAPDGPQVVAVPAGGKWVYDVFFGPGWQMNGQLRYSTHRQVEQSAEAGAPIKVGASMSWTPNGGQTSSWFLGTVEADHPTHANTRFPGFFMHPAYLPQSMQTGSRVLWEFPWQGGGIAQVRRFDLRVIGWENVTVQAGEFNAVHLEGKLQYVDRDAVKAEVRYGLWYSPRAAQIVRVLWLGSSPDESRAEMIAELASYALP